MSDCLFCKIVNREIDAKIVYEDDLFLVFHDIFPKAPVHLLLIPKQHIENLFDLNQENKNIIQEMIIKAPEIAKQQGLDDGFRLITNTGVGGGQEVNHIHFHILGFIKKANHTGFSEF